MKIEDVDCTRGESKADEVRGIGREADGGGNGFRTFEMEEIC